MSKIIILLFVVFISAVSFGQKTNNIFDKKEVATIYFRDGTIKKGDAKIIGSIIKFKKDKDSKKEKFDAKVVSKIIIRENYRDVEYIYKIVKGKKTPILVELLIKGEVSLYRDFNEGQMTNGGIHNGTSNSFQGYGYTYTTTKLFLGYQDDNIIRHVGGTNSDFFKLNKKFLKAGDFYFNDCPELVKKIESKEFTKKNLVEVVEFYNQHCGENTKEEPKTGSTNTQIKD